MAGRWKLSTPFDILDAAVGSYFEEERTENSYFCFEKHVAPALTTYRLGLQFPTFARPRGPCRCQWFRRVMVRKIAEGLSELHITDPVEVFYGGRSPEEIVSDEEEERGGGFFTFVDEDGVRLEYDFGEWARGVVFGREIHNNVLYGLLRWLKADGLFRELSEDDARETGEGERQDVRPWETIPEGWEREAVRLWWEGRTKVEIAARLHVVPKTVENRFSQLRRVYGREVVPYVDDLRKIRLRG